MFELQDLKIDVWKILCGVCAVYLLFWRHDYVAAGLFALAAK